MQPSALSLEGEARSAKLYTTAGYFVAFIALGLAYASLGPTLTELALNVGAGLTQISYGFTARGLGYLVGSVVVGRLYDAVEAHPVLILMLILTAAALIIVPTVPFLWMLIGMLFLLGVVQGGIDVGGNTLLVWVHGDKVDPYMNALHFFFGVGAFVSPIIVAQAIVISGGVRWAYWTLALLILPVAAGVARLPSPTPPSPGAKGSTTSPQERQSGTDALLVVLVAFFFFLYVGVEGSLGGWIATYAQATGFGGAAKAAYLTSVFWGAVTIGRLLSIPLAARFTPRQVLFGDLCGALASTVVLLLWPGSVAATWIGTFGAELAMASIFPTTLSLAERHTVITGTITSWFFVGGSIGGMTLPWLVGQLFEPIGPRVTIFAVLVGLVLDAFVFGLIVVHTRRADSTRRR